MKRKVFLDTMIYLHYKSIKEIDFKKIFGPEVTIILPRVTLREIDKAKNSNASDKIKKRAGKVLKLLEELISSGQFIHDDIVLEYYKKIPQIDYAKFDLNPDWSDDVLIASIIQYKNDNPDQEVILITQDSTPKLTAHGLRIAVREMPDEYKLPVDPDPLEKEVEKLQKKLNKYEDSTPKILVYFEESKENYSEFEISRHEDISKDIVEQKIFDLKCSKRSNCASSFK